ncbi:MAG: isopenicillin N synthase family oxygenase [Flavobacteriales bacterium]|nr:isopenicillin N synthase family oxygenase [Flavobacteriales bacterium]
MTATVSEIPVIDISPLLNGGDPNVVAKQIHNACTNHGFFYISGHGISEEIQNELEQFSSSFFQLPLEEKMKISMNKGGKAWRGFFPVGDELTSGKPDQKEGIYFGSELDSEHPKVKSGIPLHGKNLFPESPAELAKTVLEYINLVTVVGHAVLRGVALSLKFPPDYFEATITKNPFILFRIFHYPPQQTNSDSWGVGEHTDYGLLTILKQDAVGGLQVKSRGSWIDAPPIPNTFICNIGDMLDRMTGGLYRSTPHRVLNKSGRDRYSFPLFFDPDFDSIVKPIYGLPYSNSDFLDRWDKEDVYNFEGTYGSYLINKVSKVFPQLKTKL